MDNSIFEILELTVVSIIKVWPFLYMKALNHLDENASDVYQVKQKRGGIQQERVICAADKTTDRQRQHMLGWVCAPNGMDRSEVMCMKR
jgi:hypothetical protein